MRLFSARHEFPTEWAKFQRPAPGANQRFELALNLRDEHYPFWSQGRLESVTRVDILVWSTKKPVPASLDVFDKADKADAAAKKDTLGKDSTMGNLLIGKLTSAANGIALPAKPVGEVKLYLDDNAIRDLWIAITWGK